jgi:hypothetical protein
MDRQPYGPPGRGRNPDLAAVARLWVETTCAQQGLAVKIADPTILATVGALLGRGQAEEKPAGSGPNAVGANPARRVSRGSGRSG